MGTLLVACPSCSCHAFARETRCPSCGAPLRAADGSVQRTASAVLLGLSITTLAATNACGGGGTGGSTGAGGTQASSTTGHGGAPVTASSGMGGIQAVASYGAATTTTLGGMGPGGDAGSD
jgi:hypothetical protein